MTLKSRKETTSKIDKAEITPTKLNEHKSEDLRVFPYKHVIPVHTSSSPSLLSKESPPGDYKGFVNLVFLMLFVVNLRLIIENFYKYGVLINFSFNISSNDMALTAILLIFSQLNFYVAYFIEKIIAKKTKPEQVSKAFKLHLVNLALELIVPCIVVYYYVFNPLFGQTILGCVCINFLKIISFVLVNNDLRVARLNKEPINIYDENLIYPYNLTIKNYLYFIAAPTLCYQPTYPRSEGIRVKYVLKRLGESLLSALMMFFLIQQYAVPILQNSIKAIEQNDILFTMERVLKLSTVSVSVWLLGFYLMFHCLFNILAELMQFGDRSFYLSWWNSKTLSQYWRLWNKPVHNFMKRHIYAPCVNMGIPSYVALGVSFLFSAVFHEILFGLPTHAIKGYAFFGMLAQLPLIIITDMFHKWRGDKSSVGNFVFWISFCIVGQPLLAVLYYFDWTKRNGGI